MNAPQPPTRVAILVFPETTASVVYGMHDLFMSAGRDWGVVVDGQPGPSLMEPVLVATRPGCLTVSGSVRIEPHYPRNLSWTRPSVRISGRLARRDDAAGRAPQGGATPPGGAKTMQSGA